jgi:hypothetical protein
MEDTAIDIIFNIIGTIGVAFILLAYFLMQFGRITSKQLAYSLLNLIGSCLIMVSLLHRWNFPSAVIEICWMSISAFGVYQAVQRNKIKLEKSDG